MQYRLISRFVLIPSFSPFYLSCISIMVCILLICSFVPLPNSCLPRIPVLFYTHHALLSLTSPFPLPSVIMTGAYNSFFRMFDRETGRGVTLEAWRESSKPRAVLRTRRIYTGGRRRRGDVGVDSLDFSKKILHMAWHPAENIIAIAATNNLYIFQDRVNAENL